MFGIHLGKEEKPKIELQRVSSEEYTEESEDIYKDNIVDAEGPADLFRKWDKGLLPKADKDETQI